MPEHYDVAIVGYGPVGAFAALQLADAGLSVAIVERSTEPVVLPRAVGLDGEAVRSFQRLGLADEVVSILQAPRDGDAVSFTNSKREPYFVMPMPARGAMGWRDISMFDQPELEALLRELVGARKEIDVFLGREIARVEQDDHAVALTGSNGAVVRARYAIGADGASSFIRDALGIEWESLGYDQDWLVVDIVKTDEADLPVLTMQVCDPARLTTYVCVKDPNRRWEFQLQEGETREQMLREENIRALLDDWLPREQYSVRRAAVYQFHAATARRWRKGRVFLAGDAAHQTPPFLGQGLNAGLRDAVNLGWKLPLVLSGACNERLLDSYERERDAHARDLVEWAVAVGKLMETFAAREAGLPDPHEADESAGYGQGRSVPPLRDGVLVSAQVGGDAATGNLIAQPTVVDASGRERRLDALLGKGFAIVGRDDASLELSGNAERAARRLGMRRVSIEDLVVCEGPMDRLFDDHPVAVVRPDRYVFGVVDEAHSLDDLVLDLARKLELGSP